MTFLPALLSVHGEDLFCPAEVSRSRGADLDQDEADPLFDATAQHQGAFALGDRDAAALNFDRGVCPA